ncbi:hypothetical protein CVIRNUC_010335 [Coccomyxa viridis]|uniref:Uncharacterized protein n=1 Tax=Coccomyxa viridis TaxID=1274662 RepID=A0AAV1IJ17_9CHLO|nr:hypothetical protein CVIRNUC_010335 [Coccomyxa viridis]
MSGTYVRAPSRAKGQREIQRTKSQIERTAKVIQEALMEAAASVRNRKDRISRGGSSSERESSLSEEPVSCAASCTSPRKVARV